MFDGRRHTKPVCGNANVERTHSGLVAERPRVREPLPQLRQHPRGYIHRQDVRDADALQRQDKSAAVGADGQDPGPWAEVGRGIDESSQFLCREWPGLMSFHKTVCGCTLPQTHSGAAGQH